MVKEQIIVGKREYQLLEKHLKNADMSRYNIKKLESELRNAKVVKEEDLPKNTILLNSTVEIEETLSAKIFNFQVVLPKDANIKANKISIYSPMGAAVIGYLEGSFVEWEMPSGVQKFKIIKVNQIE